jgi:hypothetical protein
MNHQVLSGDLMNDASPASRFRNDDPDNQTMDYRHVPLVDDDEHKFDQSLVSSVQQNLVV